MSLFKNFVRQDASLLIICICILTFPLVVNIHISDMVLSIRYFLLGILILLLYLLRFKDGLITTTLSSPIFISLLLLFCISFISSFYHGFTADAIVSLNRLFVLLALTILFADVFIKKNFLLVARSVVIFISLSLIIYFIQIYIAFTNEKEFMSSVEKISSTMTNKNLLASILFLSLPFLFYVYQWSNKIWKSLVLCLLGLILCSFFLIQSKSTLLALFFMSTSIFIFAFRTNSKLILTSLFVFSIISSAIFVSSPKVVLQFQQEVDQIIRTKNRFLENRLVENDSRASLYLNTINMIQDNPLLGVGPGNWKKEFPKYGLKNTIGGKGDRFAQRPHSDFLWFFAEGGVLSGILYVLLFFFLLRETLLFYFNIKDKKRYFFLILFSTILGYLIISLLDFPMERPSHNLFFAIILAIVISERFKRRPYYNRSNKLVGSILICLFTVSIVFSSVRYRGDLHMTNVLKYKSIGDWDEMINELNMVYDQHLYDIDNTTTPLMWYYGIAYFNKEEVKVAFDYFKKAYYVNPYHLHVINNLATCYGFNNDYIKAKELYAECLAISSRFEEAALNLSMILHYENRNKEALDVLLEVHDFNLAKEPDITGIYIDYVYKIAAKLAEELYMHEDQVLKKNDIFVRGNQDRKLIFKRIKEISWMRKEKNMPYKKILNNPTLINFNY